MSGPDEWLEYDVLCYTLDEDNKLADISYSYYTDPE